MGLLSISRIGIVVIIFFIGVLGSFVLSGISEIIAGKRAHEPAKVKQGIRRIVLGSIVGVSSLILAIWMIDKLVGL